MTKKRFSKLLRAYFTRLHEWSKENPNASAMDMGEIYKAFAYGGTVKGTTREEWWNEFTASNHVFGVGKRR